MLWQYQAKAEPVLVPTAETITLDKWFQPASEPVRVDHVAIGAGVVLVHTPTSTISAAIARAAQFGCVGAVASQIGVTGAAEFQSGVAGAEAAVFRC